MSFEQPFRVEAPLLDKQHLGAVPDQGVLLDTVYRHALMLGDLILKQLPPSSDYSTCGSVYGKTEGTGSCNVTGRS